MPNTKNPNNMYNNSGCADITAYKALNNIEKEKINKQRNDLIKQLRALAFDKGFCIRNEIILKKIKSSELYDTK